MKRLVITIIFACLCIAGSAQNGYTTIKDIPYHPGENAYADERCRLDFYWPENKDCPTVVWFHGGGLVAGSKFAPKDFLDAGFAVAAVNYRFLSGATIDEIIDDAAAAVAWTFREVAARGGRTDRIFVSGHSAGGYLTDMVVLDKHYLAKYGVDADTIAGAFPYSAQVITHFNVRKDKGLGPLQPLIDETAPLYHVRPLKMPFYVMSGDREMEMNGRYEEQAYFWRMMKLVGCPQVFLYEFQGYDHGGMCNPAYPVTVRHIRAICEGKVPER